MVSSVTHRDLPSLIEDLVRRRRDCKITLQSFLENLRRVGGRLRDQHAVSLAAFSEMLEVAFEPCPSREAADAAATEGYVTWEKRISEQICDLEEMEQAGILDNEYRYFGASAPRGDDWYNFDPCTFLECAASWAADSSQDAEISSVDGGVRLISWDLFVDLLNAGQCYE